MRAAPELGIPEVKPAIESIRGRWEQKVSPRRRHAILQARLSTLLTNWAGDRGEVGSEWRFYFVPVDAKPSSLVPDVAYVSFERMPEAWGELREAPTIAPDIAIEVLSPGDRKRTLGEKIDLYLAYGSKLVVVVDPLARTVATLTNATSETFGAGEVARSNVYRDLALDIDDLFARLE
ncbi:MAG: Uma2 family endonuclease [Candidatus Baltobacteraceae bacterium]